jgi:hypothetical protein
LESLDLKWLVSIIIALAAAGASIFQAIHKFNEGRPKATVHFWQSSDTVSIAVRNVGHKEVVVRHVFGFVANKRLLERRHFVPPFVIEGKVDVKYTLKPGTSVEFTYPMSEILKRMERVKLPVPIRAFVQNDLGEYYESKSFHFPWYYGR